MPKIDESQSGDPLGWLPVLMYHRVLPERQDSGDPYQLCTTVDEFDAQMRFLKERGYKAIHLEELARARGDAAATADRRVVITFDDGYLDVFFHALPVLIKYQFTANVFLVSSCIGGTNAWDRDLLPETPLLGQKELQDMARWGISFGAHGISHRRLTRLSRQEAWEEIMGSKVELEQSLGVEVPSFSFPYGSSTPALREMVKEAGYLTACGIEQAQHTRYNVSRIDAARCRGADRRWRLHTSGLYFQLRQSRVLRTAKALLPAGNRGLLRALKHGRAAQHSLSEEGGGRYEPAKQKP